MIPNIIADSQSALEHFYCQVLLLLAQVEKHTVGRTSGESDGNIDRWPHRWSSELNKAARIYEVYRCHMLTVFT